MVSPTCESILDVFTLVRITRPKVRRMFNDISFRHITNFTPSMPSSFVECRCQRCLQIGNRDLAGNHVGTFISRRAASDHRRVDNLRIREEQVCSEQLAREIQETAGRLSALKLSGESVPIRQPLGEDMAQHSQHLFPSFDDVLQSFASLSLDGNPNPRTRSFIRGDKKERDSRTKKALSVLLSIKKEVAEHQHLLEYNPSQVGLLGVEKRLSILQESLTRVPRRVESVESAHKAVVNDLGALRLLLSSRRETIPSLPRTGPLRFDTGTSRAV